MSTSSDDDPDVGAIASAPYKNHLQADGGNSLVGERPSGSGSLPSDGGPPGSRRPYGDGGSPSDGGPSSSGGLPGDGGRPLGGSGDPGGGGPGDGEPFNGGVLPGGGRPSDGEGGHPLPTFRRRALGTSHCIFKIPEFLTCNKDNSYDYQPITVSIGPYHNGKQQLQSIEDHKHRFQEFFVLQAQRNGVSMVNLFRAVEVKEQQIRDSYSEDLVGFETEELIKMMVLDGCFLLTLLLIVADKLSFEDPILSLSWVLPSIRRDLLLLENQIPLFVLQTLLETANFPWTSGLNIMVCLNTIALEFFSYSFERASESRVVNHNVNNCGAEHLLDLIRRTFIPVPPETIIPCCSLNCGLCCSLNCGINPTPETKRFLKLVLSAKLLRSNGIKFERKKSSMVSTFLDISLSKQCELHIPEICLDNFISLVLLNCIAFEQFHAESPSYVTSYAMFMGSLINNERDAAFLGEEGIIQNYYGTDDEVCRFFKRITKDYAFDIKTSYLASVFAGVNEYTSHGYNVQCAGLKRTYCGSTWIICSSFAALALLLLTLLQVLYAAGFLTPRLQGKVNGKQG